MDFWQIYAGPSSEKARVPAKLASAADTWKEQIAWPPGRIGRKIRLATVQRLNRSWRSFALCQRLEDNPILFESQNYFGDRMLA